VVKKGNVQLGISRSLAYYAKLKKFGNIPICKYFITTLHNLQALQKIEFMG